MATVDCAITKWAYSVKTATSGFQATYNNSAITSSTSGAQIYFGGDYAAWIQFTTPAYSVTELTLWANVVGSYDTTQNYFYLGKGTIPTSNLTNQPTTKLTTGSVKWTGITASSQQFKATLTPSSALEPSATYYIKIYGGYIDQFWPNSNGVVNKVVATYTTASYYKPTSLSWNTKGQGINSADQTVSGKSSTSGYWFGGQNATGQFYYKSQTGTSPSSINFDSTSTSVNVWRYVTVSSTSTSPITVSSSSYTRGVLIPAYACTCYNYYSSSASSPCYLSSIDTTGSTIIGTLVAPDVKSGYETFVGFSTSSTSYSVSYTGSTTFTSTINGKTLYAVYKNAASNKSIALYNCSSSAWQTAWSNTTAKYCYGKGTTSGGATTNNNYMTGAPGYTPTQSGYTFLGWSGGKNTTVSYSTPLAALDIQSTLYAIFSKTVSNTMSLTLGDNGGPSLSYSTATRSYTSYKYGSGSTSSSSYGYDSACSYEPTGNSSYTWSGWCRSSDGSTTLYATPKAAFQAGYTSGNLYAIFTPSTYYIRYQQGSATTRGVPTSGYQVATPGVSIQLSSGTNWKKDSTTANYKNYTTTYFLCGGTLDTWNYGTNASSNASGTHTTYGKYYNCYDYAQDTIQYQIAGWSTSSSESSQSYALSEYYSQTGSADKYLYPYWSTSSYHVYAYRQVPTVSRTGYSLTGWSTNPSGSSITYAADASRDTTADNNMTLYAIWEANTYTIYYKPTVYCIESSSRADTSATPNTAYSLSTSYFTGVTWNAASQTYYTNYNCNTGAFSNGATSVSTSNSTYKQYRYKQTAWQTNNSLNSGTPISTYNNSSGASSITLYPYMGSNIDNGYQNDVVFTILEAPVKVGWAFKGWNTSSAGTGTMYQPGDKITQSKSTANFYNTQLYAIWEPEWTVKINNGTSWSDYHVWIYTGATSNNGWQQVIPYVYDGSKWKLTSI